MNCTTWSEKIYDYCYEILEGEELAEFQQHLAVCGHCQQLLARNSKGLQLLQNWQPEVTDVSPLVVGIRQRLLLSQGRSWHLAPWSAAAAMLMLGLSVGLVWMLTGPTDSGWNKPAPTSAPSQAQAPKETVRQGRKQADAREEKPQANQEAVRPQMLEKKTAPAMPQAPVASQPGKRLLNDMPAPEMKLQTKTGQDDKQKDKQSRSITGTGYNAMASAEPARRVANDAKRDEESAPGTKEMEEPANMLEAFEDECERPGAARPKLAGNSRTEAKANAPTAREKQEKGVSEEAEAVADTPVALLERILHAAQRKDANVLRRCLYPLSTPPRNWQVEMIKHMLIADAQSSARFAYSEAALNALMSRYGDSFQPISEDFRQQLSKGERFGCDATLADLANQSTSNIIVFQRHQVLVLLVQLAGEYRLVWWENINQLIKGS